MFFLKVAPDFSRAWLALWYVSGAVALVGYRGVVAALTRHGLAQGQLTRRAIVYGTGPACESLLQALDADPDSDIRICGVFDDRGIERASRTIAGHANLGNLDALMAFCRRTPVDMLIVALPVSAETRVLQLIKKLWVLPVDIRLAAQASKLRFRPRTYSFAGTVPLIDVVDRPITDWDVVLKWLFDKSVATLALLGLAPVMALVALAIKLDSKGPVLFRQKRYGFNNELIEVFKFRSMFVDQADANASKLVTKGDPRVTRVGRILRKSSLDELPQLFNVLRGELSLVGPRPHALQAKAADRLYDDVVDGYFARHKVKPGITGWAQINGWRGETDTSEKIQKRVEHDLYYIDNWSVLLDLYILFKTPVRPARRRERVLKRGTHDRARTFARRQARPHRAAAPPTSWRWALVWLTVASGAVVFTEPAPIDVLTMGLVVLLPVIGLVAISRSLIVLLALMLIAAAAGVLAATNATDLPLAMTHTGVSLYMYIATFMFAAFVAKRPEAHTRLILNAYVWAAVAAALLGIVGYFDLFPGAHESMTRYGRATGLFKDPNVFGPFLVPALVYGLSRLTGASAAQEHPPARPAAGDRPRHAAELLARRVVQSGRGDGDLRRAAHPDRARQPRAAAGSPCWR